MFCYYINFAKKWLVVIVVERKYKQQFNICNYLLIINEKLQNVFHLIVCKIFTVLYKNKQQ